MPKNLGVDTFPDPVGHSSEDGHPPKEKECSDQKIYLEKVAKNAQKARGRHLSRPRRPFWGPLAAILGFAGVAALQAVSERPLRR